MKIKSLKINSKVVVETEDTIQEVVVQETVVEKVEEENNNENVEN